MKTQNNHSFIQLLILSAFIFVTTYSSCSAVNGLQTYLLLDGTTCAFNCPSNTYKNNNNFSCITCDNSCNGCTDT